MNTVRPLRGRALVRRHSEELGEYALPSGLVIPATVATDPRKRKIHRGTVLALGKPAYVNEETGLTLPWDCSVGDTVYYVYGVALEKVRAYDDLVWVAQEEVQGVETAQVHDTLPPTTPQWWEPGYDDAADDGGPEEPAVP